MNCWQKFSMFLTKRKLLILLVCNIVLIFLIMAVLYLFSPPLPMKTKIQRKGNALFCRQLSSASKWIEASESSLNESPVGYPSNSLVNQTLTLYEEKKVDLEFLEGIYSYYLFHFCHRNCGIDGAFYYFLSYLEASRQYTKAWMQNELCTTPYNTGNTCTMRGYANVFRTTFSFISIPITIVINYINLTTLLKLLGKGAGAALYFHTAEIVTDALLNIIVSLHFGLYLFTSLDQWRRSCGYYQYVSVYQSIGVVQRFVSFLNQAYLMGLLADRHYAQIKPHKYYSISDSNRKKQAKSFTWMILLGTFTLYLPYFLFRTFRPTFLDWKTLSNFWENNLDAIDLIISTFYVVLAFIILIAQIICGVLVEKSFRKFIKKKMQMNQVTVIELKKRERDKQLLLIGTIGLNVITGLISAAYNAIINKSLIQLLGYSDQRTLWSLLFYMIGPVLTFINGNGALIIHIIFVKSYRKAFKATRFGRLLIGNQIQPAP